MKSTTVLLAMLASASAFSTPTMATHERRHSLALYESSASAETRMEPTTEAPVAVSKEGETAPVAPKKKPAASIKNGGPKHKEGVFSPAVLFVKELMGDKELNKLRGKVISVHSDAIAKFVDTSDSRFGDAVLKALFRFADKDGNGEISKEELKEAVQSLGFTWLQDKQIEGLFARADADGNGSVDVDEWVEAAPKTLRTNLIKLAKKNGNDMGLLS